MEKFRNDGGKFRRDTEDSGGKLVEDQAAYSSSEAGHLSDDGSSGNPAILPTEWPQGSKEGIAPPEYVEDPVTS